MNKTFRKIFHSLIFAAVIVIGGFFLDGGSVSASNKNWSMMNCNDNVTLVNSTGCAMTFQGIQKTNPANNAFMPCCLQRHDNSETTLPVPLQERVKFSQALMMNQVDCATNAIEQKIYPSSPSPPPEAESISCTVKIE